MDPTTTTKPVSLISWPATAQPTTITSGTISRAFFSPGAAVRRTTPSGEIATRCRPITAEAVAITSTARLTSPSPSGPIHIAAALSACPSKCSGDHSGRVAR